MKHCEGIFAGIYSLEYPNNVWQIHRLCLGCIIIAMNEWDKDTKTFRPGNITMEDVAQDMIERSLDGPPCD